MKIIPEKLRNTSVIKTISHLESVRVFNRSCKKYKITDDFYNQGTFEGVVAEQNSIITLEAKNTQSIKIGTKFIDPENKKYEVTRIEKIQYPINDELFNALRLFF